MSQHQVQIRWARDAENRESYEWQFENNVRMTSSSEHAEDETDITDPESAYVASLSSCHMLSFLAITAKRGFAVVSYVDDAVGFLEKNEDGRIAVTRVVLRPVVKFTGDKQPDETELDKLHEMTHRNCFIANSVRTEIVVESRAQSSATA